MPKLNAPFPYFGGKKRWNDKVWERFGEAHTYIEPFAGSLAVLLGNPKPAKREIVCDTHSAVCNFWRAVKADPEQVASYATNPTIHQDLTARHRWLIEYFTENHAKFETDPDYYDCKAAGWWCWGMSNWIGGNFCDYGGSSQHNLIPFVGNHGQGQGLNAQRTHKDKIPNVKDGGGRGVNAQRNVRDQRPSVQLSGAGRGVNAQRQSDQIPYVRSSGGGRGVNSQTTHTNDHYEFVLNTMQQLAERLFKVIVLNRSWESALTNSMIGTQHRDKVCIFVDPPYILDQRTASLYHTDASKLSNTIAHESYQWCVKHGDQFRIAYASHEGDFDVPPGWTVETQSMTGKNLDQIMFSPTCIGKDPGTLFDH